MRNLPQAAGLLCASALMFAPIAAFAQNQAAGPHPDATPWDSTSVSGIMKERSLGEVLVTTQKRVQTSIEIPTSVSALSGSMLSSLHLNQMDQVAAFIPGVQIQQQSPNNSGYAIRGVTSDEGTATSQPRVSVFLDGVSNFRTQASQVELFDLERVEVTKGPQGTLFGRGAEIGAIDIIRKKPTNRFSGEFSINGGTRGQFGLNGFLNTPLISGKLFNRFAVSYDRHNGFIKNLAGGRLNGKSALALRNSTRLYATGNTRLDLVLDYQHDDYPGTSFKSKLFAPENDYAATAGIFDANSAANLEEGEWLGIKRDLGGGQLSLSSRLNDRWTLNTLTGLRGYKSDEHFDADGTYLNLLKCTEKASGFQVSQEVRFNYDGGKRMKGFVGASYFYENVKQAVTLNTNMQYLYPAYIESSFKSKLGEYLNKDSYESLVSMIDGMDFTAITQSILPEAYASYASLYAPMVKQAVSQAFSGAEESVLGAVDQTISGQSGKAQQQLNIYGALDNSVKAIFAQLGTQLGTALLGQPLSLDMGLDQLATMMGMNLSNPSTATEQTLAALKTFSSVTLPENYNEDMTNYAQNHAIDLFADASWTLSKGLTATFGLRGTYENQRSGYSSSSDTSLNPFSMFGVSAFLYSPTENGQKVWTRKEYFSWVGRFALNYMVGRNNIYASVSRGRRPGVIEFNYTPDELVSLKPEIIWNYEAGIKGYLTPELYYDLCAYYYDWYHFQSYSLNQDDNSMAKKYTAIDAGRAHSFGLEATLRYAICKQLNIFGNYAYNNAKFNDTDEDGKEQEYAGNQFRLTPKHTFSVGANLTLPTSKTAFVYFTPSYTWKSKVYFDDDNDEELTQDAYGLLNFTLGYHFAPKSVGYDISIFGRNALDTKYIVDAGNSGRNIGFPTYIGGTRSIFGAMLKVSF